MKNYKLGYAEYTPSEITPFRPGDLVADFRFSKDIVFMFHAKDTFINIQTKETIVLPDSDTRFQFKPVRRAVIDTETDERIGFYEGHSLPEWLTEDSVFSEENFTVNHTVGFFKKDVLGEDRTVVWEKDSDKHGVYWKYYESMNYNPGLSDDEMIVGYQYETLCQIPRKLCREISTVTFICPTCKRPE